MLNHNLKRLKIKNNKYTNTNSNNKSNNNKENIIYMVVPYTKGLSESFKKHLQYHFKGGNIIKKLLVTPKIRTPSQRKME